jgi:uncharacterized integral membrane protein
MLGLLLGYGAFQNWFDYGSVTLWRAIILTALSAFCFASSGGLLKLARWAHWSAWAIGLAVASLAGDLISDAFVFKTHYSGEEGFGASLGIILLVPTLAGSVLLMLPQTRKLFKAKRRSNTTKV